MVNLSDIKQFHHTLDHFISNPSDETLNLLKHNKILSSLLCTTQCYLYISKYITDKNLPFQLDRVFAQRIVSMNEHIRNNDIPNVLIDAVALKAILAEVYHE